LAKTLSPSNTSATSIGVLLLSPTEPTGVGNGVAAPAPAAAAAAALLG
jgi:hypothetical protein